MIKYKGDGSSKEKAIIILGADDEIQGVDAEYNCLEEKLGEQDINWELNDQELNDEGIKQYDIIRIKFLSGETKEFYFDITGFYGKE